MKMFSKIMLAAIIFAGVSSGAAEALTYNKVADYRRTTKFFSDTAEGFQCKSDAVKTNFLVFGKKNFPVEAGKKYKFSCDFRLIPGCSKSSRFYFGINCLDKDGKEIAIREVNFLPGTLTELAAPAKKGDKVLKVKDASKWLVRHHAAFNAKADESDLPNREISPQILKIEKTGDCWIFSLRNAMKKDYPAGTVVRDHADGATYRYLLSSPTAKPQWTSISRIYHGFAKNERGARNDSFRLKTASVQPVIFPEVAGPFNVEFRNIKFEEVK